MKNNDKFYLTIPLVKFIEKDVDYSGNYFVYGEGGFGKTTSMILVFGYLLNKAKNGENIVPIYIDSKGLDFTYDKPVFEYIIKEYCGLNRDISQHIEMLNDLLKNSDKKYYIIIDAINEAESNKYKVIQDIASLKEIFDNNHAGRIIVSSRTDEKVYCFNDFKRIKMLDFKDEQIVDFLNKYDFKNKGKSIDKIDVERIDENLLKILRVPMFLRIFKDVYKDEDVFPDLYTKNIIRESDLLGKFVDKIIDDKMDMHKAEQSPEYIKCYFALKRFLPALAFELAKNDEFSISDTKLKKLFLEKFNQEYFYQFENLNEIYYDEIGSLKRILRNCIEDFSFIVTKGDKNSVTYSFSHQMWRDYFSALYLANSIDYDVAGEFEYQISSNIQQYVGEIIKEYAFENKTDILSPMSPIEAFMQRNCNTLSPLAIRLCIEIMKKSRNGNLTAKYNNLNLKYINFHNYNLQGSSFSASKVYEHNFIPQGHTDKVATVSCSPDGNRIVSGSEDRTIRIWDAETGKQIGEPLTGHTSAVNSVCYSPDGKRIVSGSDDGTVRIWNTETGEQISKMFICDDINFSDTDFVTFVSYSPDGKRIISGCGDNTIRILDAETGKQIGEPLTGHTSAVNSVCYSPDGKRILSGSTNGTVCIWNNETGKQINKMFINTNHFNDIVDDATSVCYSPDGKRIASVSENDYAIRIWDIETCQQISEILVGDMLFITPVVFSPDGKRIAVSFNDRAIQILDADKGIKIGALHMEHSELVSSLSYSPNGKRIVSGSYDGTIRIWDAETGKQIVEPLTGHASAVFSACCSPDGKEIMSGRYDGTIQIWDIETGKKKRGFFAGYRDYFGVLFYLPNGKRIVSGSYDGTIRIWDTETCQLIVEKKHGMLSSICCSANAQKIAIGHYGIIALTDVEMDVKAGELWMKNRGFASSVSYSPNGKRIVSGDSKGVIHIWNIANAKLIIDPFAGHTDTINSVSYSPNGIRIVSCSNDETIRIWNAETGKQICEPLVGHRDRVNAVSYSPNGTRIVSCSRDETIRIWNAETGKLIGEPLVGHTDSVIAVSYLPDGKRIVSGGKDNIIRIWDLETHLCTVLKVIIQSNIQKCDFRNSVFCGEDINDFCHILYCNGADVPKEYEPKPIPFEWNDEEFNDKESE